MSTHFRRIPALLINALLLMAAAGAQQPDPPPAGNAQPDAQTQNGQNSRNNGNAARWQQQRRFNAFAQSLKLTPEQRWQIAKIQKETAQSVTAVRQDSSLNEEQMKQKVHELHSQQHQKIVALLTTEQQEALKKWAEEHKPQHNPGSAGDSASPSDQEKAEKAKEATETDDEFFAGMTQDPEPQPVGAQRPQAKARKD